MPFPQEHSQELGQEIMNVLGGDVMVSLKPGRGESHVQSSDRNDHRATPLALIATDATEIT